ncbi:MAG: CHAT domain-containing protein, partial [Pseudomonadota bacterium]
MANFGDALQAANNFKDARSAYEKALRIIDTALGPRHERSIYALRELGVLAFKQGNYAEAVAHFRKAVSVEIEITKRSPGDAGLVHRGVFDWMIRALWKAGETKQLPIQEVITEALEITQWTTLSAAGSAITKMGERLQTPDPELAKLIRDRQDLGAQWETIDRSLIASALQPDTARDLSGEKALRAKLAETKQRFSKLDEQITAGFPAYTELAMPRPVKSDRVLDLLRQRPEDLLFVFDVSDAWIDLWLVDPQAQNNSIIWRRIKLTRDELRAHVHSLRCGLDGGEWVGSTKRLACLKATGGEPDKKTGQLPFRFKTAHQLYQSLFGAFSDRLAGRNLIIVGNDALARLPFHALLSETYSGRDPSSAQWFGLSHPISVSPTVAALKTLRRDGRQSPAKRPYLGVGNPLLTGASGKDRSAWSRTSCPRPRSATKNRVARVPFDRAIAVRAAAPRPALAGTDKTRLFERVSRMTPLPETADEVCAVAETLGANQSQVVLGAQATESDLRVRDAAGELSDYRVVHFATHGVMANEIDGLTEPALVMTPPKQPSKNDDGLLTASEVASLRLN